MHFNETNGRYGFGSGKFLMVLKYKPSEDVPNLAGRVVGYLPELPNESSFHKDLCPNRFTKLCVKPNGMFEKQRNVAKVLNHYWFLGQSSCPISANEESILATDMAFEGSYYRGIPVNMKIELFSTATPQNTCVTQDSIAEFGDPIVCFIVQGYFL